MKYTVVWKPEAERRLTELWMESEDQQTLADAADLLERELAVVPESLGEERDEGTRVVIMPPVGMHYRVYPDDRQVLILTVWAIE